MLFGPSQGRFTAPTMSNLNGILPRFPENEAAGWVSAGDLRVLDEQSLRPSDVPFYRAVRAYLERRTLCQTFRTRLGDPDTPLIESSKVLRSYDSSSFCPGAPLAAPNVYLMGPDKSRFSMGQSSWSAHSYGRSLMQGVSIKHGVTFKHELIKRPEGS
ncbi:hypothetical protein FOPG_15650 [Fusarium oxysporum f. sp. conglutinans race 2 54008]|uniref:Uncharacterized protein n=1 Tax=Fusarium oxysporum f. sp. conglutinans race 2 54008 TaxID=1089457 RepID=X0H8N7_FUSOX|nr:hypothetical protein FOPG_15650 [Fusarium oxysporum f. sp. conglutinans race 2 54008]